MGRIYKSVDQTVGHTPLLEFSNIEKKLGLEARIAAKLEFFNPAGSSKDRVARRMLDDAEADGRLDKNTVIIEPTSGNTGIGLASIGTARGYRVVIVMPDSMSIERQKLMKAFGAELVLTPGARGMSGAIERAEELAKEYEKSFIPGQFENPSNAYAHYETTGPEIWEDTDGNVDIFVAGVGTGGTLTGTGRYLREKNPEVKLIAVEPASSPVLSEGRSGRHDIQGIGADFVPKVLDTELYDGVFTVEDEEAYSMARMLGREEGVLCGISSGAAVHAAIELARLPENKGKMIITLLPDAGDRYMSTRLFDID